MRMKLGQLAPLLVLTAWLAGCEPAVSREKPAADDRLIGCWLGEDIQPETNRPTRSFMDRRADGSFVIGFSDVADPDDPEFDQQEEGEWRHKDGVYTAHTLRVAGEKVDPEDTYYIDRYRVEWIAAEVVALRHEKSGATFKAKKVDCPKPRGS
jgi:hypothetical protein